MKDSPEIVGLNVVREQEADLEEMVPLGFGFCTLALAVPKASPASAPADLAGTRIATTHPRSLRRYLAAQGIAADIIELHGGAEIAPSLDVADAICDLVSTGTTLRMHDLRRIGDVWDSQAWLVANPSLDGEPVVSRSTYAAAVFMVVATTMATPPLLVWAAKRSGGQPATYSS